MQADKFDKRQMLKHVGDFSQLFGSKEYTLTDGKAKGMRAFDVRNGSGLEFTVLADRGLDIAGLSFKGINCSYISKTGLVAPEYYEKDGVELLRSFFGGFLTTCGLRNVGGPCEDEGEHFGLHGRISHTPAEEVRAGIDWEDGLPVMSIGGMMREARLFGENMVLRRKIRCHYGDNRIQLQNTIENLGFRREPLMLLFHFNLGYPLLDEDAELITSTAKLVPRTAEAKSGIDDYARLQPPTAGYAEQVFYHNLNSDAKGNTIVALINKKIELGVALRFNKNQLFNFTQWKQMGEGEYVLGLEPCNCYVEGRLDAKNREKLEYLEPGEERQFDIGIELIEGLKEIETLVREVSRLAS